MEIQKVDYLRKYNLFNSVLFIWVLFLPLKNAIYQISLVIMVGMFVYHVYYFNNFELVKKLIEKNKDILLAFSLLVLGMLLSSIFGVNVGESLSITIKFIYRYILLFILLIYFYKLNFFTHKILIIMILISLSIYGFDGFYQYIAGVDFFKNFPMMGEGLTGPLFNRNIFGLVMAIEANILLFLLLYKNSLKERIFIFLLLVLIIFLLLNSLSRSSWLFFFVFTILSIILWSKQANIRKSNIILFLLSIGILLAFMILTNENLSYRFELLLEGDGSGRLPVWIKTIEAIKVSWLFGYGVDSYIYVIKETIVTGVHNVTLEILLYLGFFGLFTYIYFFFIIFKEVINKKQYIIGSFIIAFLVALQFDGSLVNSKLDLSILTISVFWIYSNRIDSKYNNTLI